MSVITLGTLDALWATTPVTNRELVHVSYGTFVARANTLGLVAECASVATLLNVTMQLANCAVASTNSSAHIQVRSDTREAR